MWEDEGLRGGSRRQAHLERQGAIASLRKAPTRCQPCSNEALLSQESSHDLQIDYLSLHDPLSLENNTGQKLI